MKFLSLIALFFTFTVFAEFGPVNRSLDLDGAGNSKGVTDQYFINVYNSSGSSIADGSVVILDVTMDDGYSVTTTTTAGKDPHCVMVGVCAAAKACKCQTYGLHTTVDFDARATATAGEYAFISEVTAGKVDAKVKSGGGLELDINDKPIGVFYDSPSSSGDVEVFIKLR